MALILGACMGSFLNCTAIRIGRSETFVRGRSHCMHCGHELSVKDLIPVISWVWLKGRCRYCREKISARYPLVEIIFALVTLACLLKFDLTVLCLRNYILLSVLFLLTLTDLDTMTIPDSCHIIAVVAWVLSAPLLMSWPEIGLHVLAAVLFGGGVLVLSLVMDRVMGRDTLGGGDIKLLAVAGLYFGLIGTMLVLILSGIIGLLMNGFKRKKEFPFGPWIAVASAAVLFAGEPLINWYMGLLGL
ncbi:MAG: prepilin peptidase [Firmicutes bacterium]|nr:prepilin peptidase [Bacillota bacterium]